MSEEPQSRTSEPLSTWRSAWWRAAAVLTLSLVLAVVLLAALVLLARPLALLFLAVCIASALSPVVRQLSARLPRNIAIILVYLVLLGILILVILAVAPAVITQISELRQRLPEIIDSGGQLLEQYGLADVQFELFINTIEQVGRQVIAAPFVIFSTLLDAVLILIVSLYLLLDAPNIRRFSLSLFGSTSRRRAESIGNDMLHVCGGYVRGIVINMVLVGLVTSVGLTLIGLPFALVLGLVSGLLEALPIVGTLIAAIPVLLVALFQSPTIAIITLIFVIVVQQIQGNVITPNIMRGEANIPQFIVPIAVLAGGGIGGVLGAIVVVPLVAVIRVLLLRVVAPWIRQQTGAVDDA